MKFPALLCSLTLLLMVAGCSKDSSNPTAPEKEPFPDPFTLNTRLGRGMNLGNALEAPNEGEWGVTLRSEYFDWIKSAGFNSIRLPVRWSAHTASAAPYTIAASFLRRVDWAVSQALANDLPVVLNIHHFEELMQNPAAEKARFLAIWEQLAAHYRDHSPALVFEVLNEPMANLSPAWWNEYLQEAIGVIRKTNPTRTLMVGPANWYSMSSLNSLLLPEQDEYLIVSVHYYNPFAFTHQGAEWVSGSDAWLGTQWLGTAAEQQPIARDFAQAAAWASANNRPLNLGEFGAYSKADMSSRARWTGFVARLAETNGISWHYWEFIAGFGAYDAANNQWHEPLLRALIPKPGPLP